MSLSLSQTTTSLAHLSLDPVFQAFEHDLWHAGATHGALLDAVQRRSVRDFHQAWCDLLAKPRRRFLRRLATEPLLALWFADTADLSGRELELAYVITEQIQAATAIGRPATRRSERDLPPGVASACAEVLAGWLREATGPLGAWETIAIGEILLRQAPEISAEHFLRAMGLLHATAQQQAGGERVADTTGANASSQPFLQFRDSPMHCEAVWILGLMLQPCGSACDLRSVAADELSETLLRCTDQDGLIHGSLVPRLSTILVPLTRAATWGQAFQQPIPDQAASGRFSEFIACTTMLLLPDGSFLVPQESETSLASEVVRGSHILRHAAKLAGFRRRSPVRRLIAECEEESDFAAKRRRRVRHSSADRRKAGKAHRCCAAQSDLSCLALMRSSPGSLADTGVIEWHSADVRLYLAALGIPFLGGTWAWEMAVNGRRIEQPATWNCTCWFQDDEVAFAELEAQHETGVRLIRHVLLSRCDQLAILTETASGESVDDEIWFSSTLPMVAGVAVDRDAVTRELHLQSAERTVRVFPLGLPDDRIIGADDRCEVDGGQLRLEAHGRGSVTVPLFLDWHPSREAAPAEWARLTVAETRRRLGPAEAAAFRLRIGKDQWLIYRSLGAARAARTVLGLHTADESVYGRVTSCGQVEAIVRVEGFAPSGAEEGAPAAVSVSG